MAIKGYGTTLTGSATGTLGNIISITAGNITIDTYDVSSMSSSELWKDFLAGMRDSGEITASMYYDGSSGGIAGDIYGTATTSGGVASETWTVTFRDSSSFVCSGFLTNAGVTIPFDNGVTQDITIKCTGAPTFTEASSSS